MFISNLFKKQDGLMVKNEGLAAVLTGSQSQCHDVSVVRPFSNDITSLSLIFFICKMKIYL